MLLEVDACMDRWSQYQYLICTHTTHCTPAKELIQHATIASIVNMGVWIVLTTYGRSQLDK